MVLYPKTCYNEQCCKEVNVYLFTLILLQLFSSRRRVRIFLMDAEEEDEDEEEELEGGDVSTQSEADANQSAASMTVDCGTEKMEEGNEDKENTSVISTSSDNLPT